MNIGSGLDTVSSLYGQQKSNYMKAPVSAEKTFYTAETPKVYQIFTTDNMLWTGGNGTGIERQLARDSRTQITAEGEGVVDFVDATTIRILYDRTECG